MAGNIELLRGNALRIINYPHPTLRHQSKPLRRVDAELRAMARQMLEIMYASNGIGLAANQVDLPYRLFVANLTADPAEKGDEHVFVNPVIRRRKGSADDEEGCLSLPGVLGQVKRAEQIVLNAFTLGGEEIEWELSGLFSRMVQHEIDHLDGILFIDRLSDTGRMEVKEALIEFELSFAGQQKRGEIPRHEEIAANLRHLEELRT